MMTFHGKKVVCVCSFSNYIYSQSVLSCSVKDEVEIEREGGGGGFDPCLSNSLDDRILFSSSARESLK
jgi:hypothetical protein